MSISYTKTTLSKLEDLFKDLKYRIRYERGNFQSGYCIVNTSRIVVINKFFDTKARIESLIDILSKIDIPEEILTDPAQETLQKILKLDTLVRKMVA